MPSSAIEVSLFACTSFQRIRNLSSQHKTLFSSLSKKSSRWYGPSVGPKHLILIAGPVPLLSRAFKTRSRMKGAIGLTIFLFLLAKSQESIREMVWIRARIGFAHKSDEKQLIAHFFPRSKRNVRLGGTCVLTFGGRNAWVLYLLHGCG